MCWAAGTVTKNAPVKPASYTRVNSTEGVFWDNLAFHVLMKSRGAIPYLMSLVQIVYKRMKNLPRTLRTAGILFAVFAIPHFAAAATKKFTVSASPSSTNVLNGVATNVVLTV